MAVLNRVRSLVLRLVPASARGVAQELRALTPAQRGHYLRTLISSFRGPVLPTDLTPASRITFVCHGNIFRSPMAEALLVRELARVGVEAHGVSSAGLSARSGRSAHENAIVVAASLGVSLLGHRARLLTQKIVNESDLIVVMDRMNVAILADRFPAARSRSLLLGTLDPQAPRLGVVIVDPYGKTSEDVLSCYRRIERSVVALADVILRSSARETNRSD